MEGCVPTFKNKAQWIEGNPDRVAEPSHEFPLHLDNAEHVIRVADQLHGRPAEEEPPHHLPLLQPWLLGNQPEENQIPTKYLNDREKK